MGAALLLCSTALPAQDAGLEETGETSDEEIDTLSAEEVLADSETLVGPPLPPECEPDPFNENRIIICAPRQDTKFRVQEGFDWRTVGHKGDTPRAPDLFGIPDHGVVAARGCFIGPCPPEQPIIIDLDAIPEAPPGSDADRVARGLAPRGNDNGSGLPAPVPLEPAPTQD